MSLPIKLTELGDGLVETPSGDLVAHGVRITRDGGWLDVRTLASALALGAPAVVPVRLRLQPAAGGNAALEAWEVLVGSREIASPGDVEAQWAEFWRASLADAVRAEIERALNAARRATRRMQAIAAPAGGEGDGS